MGDNGVVRYRMAVRVGENCRHKTDWMNVFYVPCRTYFDVGDVVCGVYVWYGCSEGDIILFDFNFWCEQ